MERIVVGFDGSEEATRAVHVAAEMAHKFGASLSVVYAMPAVARSSPWTLTSSILLS